MSNWRHARSHGAFAPILLGLLQPFGVSSQSQAVVPTSTMPPRPNSLPECEDPVTAKKGYEPICPPGYFKCCATCKGATCFSTKGLHLSWRGIRECIMCQHGDYCTGCDTYQRCRPSDIKGREGPKIAPMGSTRPQDCEVCPSGYEADLERKKCVKKWTDVCNHKYVARCVRNCRSADPKKGKNLDFCEKTKCQLECAKRWSDACVDAFGHECRYRKAGPSEYDLYTEGEEWLTDCDVDCNGPATVDELNLPLLIGMLLMIMALPPCCSKCYTIKTQGFGGKE